MSVPGFFITNVTGTIARLYLIRRLGEAFERPIDDVLDFIARYRAPLLVVSITVFAVMMVRELRQGSEDSRRSRTPSTRSTDADRLGPIGAGSERCRTSSPSSAHASGKASRLQNDSRSKSAPRRSPRWIDSARPWVTTIDRRAVALTAARRRPPRAIRSATEACGSQPSGCSPRR